MTTTQVSAHPAVAHVLGGTYNALGQIKALGRAGIPVRAYYHRPDCLAAYSRYAAFSLAPDPGSQPEQFLQFLIDVQKRESQPGVLCPASDIAVQFMSRYRKELAKYFHFVLPSEQLIEKFLSKEGFDELAKEHGLPVPQTFTTQRWEDIFAIKDQIEFPCLIKPFYSYAWRDPRIARRYGNRIKALQVNSPEELEENFRFLCTIDPRMVIQEIVLGADDANYSLLVYIPRNQKHFICLLGKKYRLAPVHYGVGSFVESVWEQDLVEMGKRFLQSCGYVGAASLQFKRDPVRKKTMAIELNARLNMWNLLGAHCGINFPLLYYRDALNLPLAVPQSYRTGVKWASLELDLYAYSGYHRENGLTFWKWLRSYRGPKVVVECSDRDWGPLWFWSKGKLRQLGFKFRQGIKAIVSN